MSKVYEGFPSGWFFFGSWQAKPALNESRTFFGQNFRFYTDDADRVRIETPRGDRIDPFFIRDWAFAYWNGERLEQRQDFPETLHEKITERFSGWQGPLATSQVANGVILQSISDFADVDHFLHTHKVAKIKEFDLSLDDGVLNAKGKIWVHPLAFLIFNRSFTNLPGFVKYDFMSQSHGCGLSLLEAATAYLAVTNFVFFTPIDDRRTLEFQAPFFTGAFARTFVARMVYRQIRKYLANAFEQDEAYRSEKYMDQQHLRFPQNSTTLEPFRRFVDQYYTPASISQVPNLPTHS